jgi:predicted site-specific integrase-resolvase
MAATNMDKVLLKDGYVPAVQVAEILNVSLSTMHHWIATKRVRGKVIRPAKRARHYVLASDALKKYGDISPSVKKQLQRLCAAAA